MFQAPRDCGMGSIPMSEPRAPPAAGKSSPVPAHPLARVPEPRNPLTRHLVHFGCSASASIFHIPRVQASRLKIGLSTCAQASSLLPTQGSERARPGSPRGLASASARGLGAGGTRRIPPLSRGPRPAPAETWGPTNHLARLFFFFIPVKHVREGTEKGAVGGQRPRFLRA